MGLKGYAVQETLGKTIACVVAAGQSPTTNIFLVFTDGTYYEFYGEIYGAGGVDKGDVKDVERYIRGRTNEITIIDKDYNWRRGK